jgi:phosphoglycolate phosphatase
MTVPDTMDSPLGGSPRRSLRLAACETRKYSHIIWDWNGTLLDDAGDCVDVVNTLLAERNLPPLTLEKYRDGVDFPVINFYRQLGFTFQNESFEDVAHIYIERYLAKIPQCSLQAGAAEILDQLTAAGFSHSLLSAYQQKLLKEAVGFFGLTDHFIAMIGLDDIYARGKLENGKRWIKKLHVPPAQVIFVGDMLHDFEVAHAMNVDCVLLTTGHQSKARLAACGVPMFDSLTALADWLIS